MPRNYNDSLKTNDSSSNSNNTSNPVVRLPKVLVADGKINRHSITAMDKSNQWIINTLKNHGIESIDNILVAMYDTQGKFLVQYYDDYEKEGSQ